MTTSTPTTEAIDTLAAEIAHSMAVNNGTHQCPGSECASGFGR